MKKLILIPALLLGSLAMATQYDYEITPVIGYNIAEGNIDIENQMLVGVEAQYNGFDSIISPELSVLYTNAEYDYSNATESTNIYRIALNGVYQYENLGFITPLAKVGVGYETMSSHLVDNEDSPFIDAGVGAKIPFTDNIALKLEAVYMLKNNDNRWDNNLALLAGINIAFGGSEQKIVETQSKPVAQEPVQEEAVQEELLQEEAIAVAAVEAVAIIDGDDDQDTVLNSVDACPNTPMGVKVDEQGCPVIVNLHVNFDNAAYTVDAQSQTNIQKFADFLNLNKNYSTKILGYTDSVGRTESNQKLSEKRATVIRDMLVEKGVEAHRVESVGMGEANPIATNDTAEGRAQNRRIEAELIKK